MTYLETQRGRSSRPDGPRERLGSVGPAGLSLVELLSLLLGNGTTRISAQQRAEALLRRFGSLDELARAPDAELLRIAGMGHAKLAALRAAFELAARSGRARLRQGVHVRSPQQVYGHFRPRLGQLRQEVFYVLLLDSRNRLMREVEVSRGSLNRSLVHPREVYSPALREAAAAIIVAHNHPSGDPEPSAEDRSVTRRLQRAGEILGIPLLDHVVLGRAGFCSFARRGWLETRADSRADR